MANQEFAGFVYDDAGTAINGATVHLYDRNDTDTSRANTTTNSSGYWSISHSTEGRFDVEITYGSSVRRLKYDTSQQFLSLEVADFTLRNPANTYEYDIVPSAITADRQLNLPLIAGTRTLIANDTAMADSEKILLGTGSDLTLYHDGSNSYITNATGALKLATETSGIAVTIGHSTSEVTVADNLTVTGTFDGSTIDASTDFTVGSTVITDDVITFTPSTSDTVTMTSSTNGAFSLVTVDNAAAAANIQITADGTVDIDSAGVLTLDSGAAINIEPASGEAILLDGTISIDAGVLTGATAITSATIDATTDFTIGSTVITDDVITFTPSTSDTVTLTSSTNGAFSLVTVDNAAAAANVEITADGTFTLTATQVILGSSTGVAQMETNGLTIGLASSAPAPDNDLVHIWKGSAGSITGADKGLLTIENNDAAYINFLTPNDDRAGILVGDPQDLDVGRIWYDHANNDWEIYTAGYERVSISDGAFAFQTSATTISTSTGDLTLDPAAELVFNLSGGAQLYEWDLRSNWLTLQSQSDDTNSIVELYSKKGDGGDDVQFTVYGVGTPGSVSNNEKMSFMYDADSTFEIRVEASGSGTQRNLEINDGAGTSWATFTAGGGLHLGSATGGNKGAGSINATAIWDDNSQITDYVFEDDYTQMAIHEMRDFYTREKHLPTIPGREQWEEDGGFPLGKISTHLWETVEVQAKYIAELNERINTLEAR
jgi:hypothetical protein